MIDFTKRANQSTLLYNNSSIISSSSITNHSTTNTSSSASQISSVNSETTSTTDPFSLAFLTENNRNYHKLLDDLSIIDNIYDTFGYEPESTLYDRQVLDVARHVASKQQVIDTILQSETNYIQDLVTFHEVFALKIEALFNESTDKEINAKFKATPARKDMDNLFQILHEFAQTHTIFLKDLKERISLWGPTQLISDVLNKLYASLTIYEPFMQHHAEFVMVLDALYKLPAFVKFLDQTLSDNKNRHIRLKTHDLIHYLHVPLTRLSVYSKAISQMTRYSDPAHPDYTSLLLVSQKFKKLQSEWSEKVQDCQSHLMVLEAFRTIRDCPINITIYRRLLLFANLIKVDLDDITLTSDVRMYFLYNDSLIYCKNQKEKKGDIKKLVHSGKLSLRGADIRQLAPAFCAKMVEAKKPLFRIGKKSQTDPNSLPGVEAFGFEVITSEINIDAMSPMHQNYQSATAGGGAPILRRHILRTASQTEQTIWFETMRKAIKTANSLPA